ncbi:MAG: hypothetical protein Q7R56_01095 [Nanoarchaeota archaeon]|nr:hypothetical protein [Nanoarchaeota archaeon]
MPIIYILGNPFLQEDSLPHRLLPTLKKNFPNIIFKELDPTETLPEQEHLLIIDTVINIKKPCIITDVAQLAAQPTYSLHDFDLGFNLQLMKKLGKITTFHIIGLPPTYQEQQAIDYLEQTLPTLLK